MCRKLEQVKNSKIWQLHAKNIFPYFFRSGFDFLSSSMLKYKKGGAARKLYFEKGDVRYDEIFNQYKQLPHLFHL